jgi:hypothetical protein
MEMVFEVCLVYSIPTRLRLEPERSRTLDRSIQHRVNACHLIIERDERQVRFISQRFQDILR